ncbi:anti-sigma factor family protein [Roseibium aggregatum]|uniref:Anti-sigma factor n=1 Tax=Roseibium aggregatum TaxID=187304 RepID=A0A939EI85_9HYPH|nr:anti-sigma factor [Roseibium aggregatum]MBN9672069.1 anti-sigma factor [Roseibium aggregatum]
MNSSTETPIREEDLVRYVDNELSPQRRLEVEAYLRENRDAADRVAEDRKIAGDLKAAFSGLPVNPPVLAERRRATPYPPLAMTGAIAAALLIGVFAGWTLKPVTQPPARAAFLSDALAAHRTFAVEVVHPVEVAAEDERHLATWLGNRLNRPFHIPDLRVAGLTLMGGRLLPGAADPAAQLMYDDADGKRVTVYLRRDADGEAKFQFAKSGPEQAFFWSNNGFTYAVTGDLSRQKLLDLANLIQTQFDPDRAKQ